MIDSDSTDYLYSIIHFFVLNCNFLVLVFLFFYCIIFFNKILLLLLLLLPMNQIEVYLCILYKMHEKSLQMH